MAQANVFPAFINVELDRGSTGFRDFRRDAEDASSHVKRQFERDMSEVSGIVRDALKMPGGGFNIDTAGLRQAATEAERTAQGLRVVARAAEEAARETDDTSAATRRYILAAQAAAREAEDEARALSAKATSYERLQDQINRTGTQLNAFAVSNRRAADSQGALRQASIGAGQQLQDVAISLYSGQKAGVVFAQQLPQLAFALSALEGSTNKTAASVGRFATFLSGPWGLAVGLGVGVLATLTAGLFDNADAADVAENAHKALEKRLSDMSTFFDFATGAVIRQNEALIANARLKRLDEIDALRGTQKDRATEISRLVVSSGAERFENAGSIADPIIRSIGRDTTIVDAINKNKGDQKAISDALLTIARGRGDSAGKARRILELRGEAFSANADVRELSLEEESLASGRLAKELLKPKKTPRGRSTSGSAERELKAAQAIEDAVTSSANAVANLRSQFDEAPRDIDRAAKAALDFEKVLTEIDRREKAGKRTDAQKAEDEETRRLIEDAQKRLIPEFKQRPVDDRIKAADKELQLQRLILLGRTEEAEKLSFTHDLMRQLNVDTEEQLQTELRSRNITEEKLALMYAQHQQLIENERVQARMDRSVRSVGAKLQELDRARSSVENAIAALPNDARGALKDFAGNIRAQVNDIIARRIADNVFGDMFKQLEDEIRGKKPIDAATDNYVSSTVRANAALIDLTEGFIAASSVFRGAANDNISPAGAFANIASAELKGLAKSIGDAYDPSADIVVTAPGRSKISREQRQASEALNQSAKSLKDLARQAAEGAFIGQSASSLVFGAKSNALGSAIGGAIGGKLGEKFLGKGLESIAKGLGDFAGPLGSIAGGLLGSVVGNLFGGTKKGSATIGGSGSDLSVASYTGNSAKFKQAAGTGADSAIATVNRIAEMLGADVNASAGSVSIGIRDGKYRVDTSGRGITKVKKGAIDFGDDAEAAIRAATMDLIKDGVLTGLKASTQRLLQQGKDLDAALQKALDFESVFSRLKEYDNPVAAALDTLDKEFTRLKKVFGEAGASAGEYAELERLYGIERAKAIEEATNRFAGSLKDLYGELTVGDNGKSLRDRLAAAQGVYDPLKARVAAGDRSAYDAFAQAAQDLLGIQREFSGSQSPYFALLNEVTQLTKSALDRETDIVSLATNRDSPFTSTGSLAASFSDVRMVGAIQDQTQVIIEGFRGLLQAMNDNSNPNLGGAGFTLARMF